MTHLGLFEGEGGFSLAAFLMGWETIAWCEWNDFGRHILSYHFPNSEKHGDITKTDFTIYRGKIDILTGGFPCQPYSVAGKQKGTEDERHLWPEMLRSIREVQPRWIVGENVRGLVNWNGGLVFDQVQSDLEAEGYEVFPFLLPAAGVNAPHRRERIWFVAYSKTASVYRDGFSSNSESVRSREIRVKSKKTGTHKGNEPFRFVHRLPLSPDPCHERCINGFDNRQKRSIQNDIHRDAKKNKSKGNGWECWPCEACKVATNPDCRRQPGEEHGKKESGFFTKESFPTDWSNFPTQSPICSGDDGLPYELVRQRIREDSMGYLSEKEIDKIISKAHTEWIKESIKAGGNAIVPQVALQIFKAIKEYEKLTT